MKKIRSSIFFLLGALIVLSACGITQELDESLAATKELKTNLTEQKKILEELLTAVEKIHPSFEKDLETQPETGLFNEEEGSLYKNFNLRKDILSELEAGQKSLNKIQKEVQRISDKKALDVDNDKLHLISSSLQIIINNYDSLILYMNTGFEQEEELYTNLPVDNLDDQGSVIYRTYGSVTMVTEEALSNMTYTTSLVKDYETQAAKHTK